MHSEYDSIFASKDSFFIKSTEFYKVERGGSVIGVPVTDRPYSIANDDYVTAGLFLLFFAMVMIIYRSRTSIGFRMKEFFASKRTYSAENTNENARDPYNMFMLTSISALSLSLVFFNQMSKENEFDSFFGIPYWLFAAGYVVFMVFIYFKAWLYALVNWTFFDRDSSLKWISGYMFATALTSFLIFPLSLLAIYYDKSSQIVIYGFTILFILYELLLFFKLFVNFECKKYGYLLIILYFCSVELMPAIAMSRIWMWANDSFIVKNLLY